MKIETIFEEEMVIGMEEIQSYFKATMNKEQKKLLEPVFLLLLKNGNRYEIPKDVYEKESTLYNEYVERKDHPEDHKH